MSVPTVPKPFPQQKERDQLSVPDVPALYRAGTVGTVIHAKNWGPKSWPHPVGFNTTHEKRKSET